MYIINIVLLVGTRLQHNKKTKREKGQILS